MNQFRFGSKATTLRNLETLLSIGLVCPQFIVERAAWERAPGPLLDEVLSRFGPGTLAVRSSARGEDSEDESLAGAYTSLLDVAPEHNRLQSAVSEVFDSYQKADVHDEVLVQPMVRNVVIAGVVLTRDLDTGGPYYVINYDSGSGRTDVVTSGEDSKAVYLHRSHPEKLKSLRMRRLIESIIEVESVTGSNALDIEFCINDANEVYILQVRPLAARRKWSQVSDRDIDSAIDEIRDRIVSLSRRDPVLGGSRTVLSEMTDWNPAEMIGNAPKPLALSLYKTLITDGVWAEARARMGYRMVPGPLLHDLHGRPYIDVRKSFNSFLPYGIAPDQAEMIVSHQLNLLAENRELHDKVEFAIAVTCQDFNNEKIGARLADAGLTANAADDVRQQVHQLTAKIVDAGADGLTSLIEQADTLLNADAPTKGAGNLKSARALLDRCRKNGTLPFSQLARHGFIGVQLLQSLVARDVLGAEDVDNFMHGVHTVAHDLIQDMNAVHAQKMPLDAFLSRYGHLRPGTYDITSARYDEQPELYLGHGQARPVTNYSALEVTEAQRNDMQQLVNEAGFTTTTESLLGYIAAAIKGREQSKFAFTRALSDGLNIIAEWGEMNNFERDDLAYLQIGELAGEPDVGRLRERIAQARETYGVTRALRLPHVILDSLDIDVVRMPLGQPTYVTSRSVTAQGYVLTDTRSSDIDDKIVLIESADPGFDWIFSHRVLGLITKYGGANSHMAIRCAEFGLPAAIGCGERLFETLCKANTIELNAAARRIACH